MTDIIPLQSDGTPQVLADAIEAVNDRSLDYNDRGAIFGVLHALQLRINRALRPAKQDLIAYMESHAVRNLGPLAYTTKAVDPQYVCNDPGNWGDSSVQDQLEAWRAERRFTPYIRAIPSHLEVDTLALAKGFADNDPAAGELKRACDAAGFRVEKERKGDIKVTDADKRKAAA